MIEIFVKGGPIMWPLLLTSLTALAIVLERLVFFTRVRRAENPDLVRRILDAIRSGHTKLALQLARDSQDPVVLSLNSAMTGEEEAPLEEAYACAAQEQAHEFHRGLDSLDTIITLAPLLGLLGTVTGMIGAFGLIGGGELDAPVAITGGIAEALIATAFGLGIAIVTLVPLNLLQSLCDRVRFRLEDTGSRLEMISRSAPPVSETERRLVS